jgi:hypothetical protein
MTEKDRSTSLQNEIQELREEAAVLSNHSPAKSDAPPGLLIFDFLLLGVNSYAAHVLPPMETSWDVSTGRQYLNLPITSC